ncbi:C40 family peptidase [Lewinella sp. IMCC34183]|uniref:C40 family peptidase n=1 Tax=Lewinella sp. IMCC34183 TaxID=2248762 RepID=UPI00130079A4|nr:C40 family peptidase [Lewinella sp. IMCC34183]
MKLPTLFVFFFALALSSCNSFRPVTDVRNPSRTSTANNTPRTRTRPTAARPPRRESTGERVPPPAAGSAGVIRNTLVSHAEKYLGLRYKYGGNTPREGFDCSGFVKYLYDDQGISIHRVSRDQARQGKEIDARQARPGDLVFFRRGPNQPVFHVSMIVSAAPGELWVIHPTSSRGVIRENILASSYWRPKVAEIKTFLP